MITVIVTFQLPKPLTLDEPRWTFLSTAPKYQVAGLVRKTCLDTPVVVDNLTHEILSDEPA